jgi:DNA-binding NarL/FixJ family response regulator
VTTRVLLVDDHAMMREGLSVLLVNAGMEIVGSVGTGRDAVRAAGTTSPDVVVMDLSMPEMNGLEATREICARLPAVQVVMLSMHSNREHVYQALNAGASGYVLKDAASTELVSAVRAVCAGRRYVSPALGPLTESSGHRGPLASLSARERQVLQLVVEGRTSAEIAQAANLSTKTVETYRSRLMKKLGVSDVASLVKLAIQHGLTPPG